MLKVGVSRVWIDPTKIDRVSTAITRKEILNLIKEGTIGVVPKRGVSRARVKEGKRGPGSRKKGFKRGQRWVIKIRNFRAYLKTLKDKGIITKDSYRELYRMAKGGFFESKSHLDRYMKSEGLKKK